MTIYFYTVREEYGCFSNFSPHCFELDELYWTTSEHYFQAQKFVGTVHLEQIQLVKNPRRSKAIMSLSKNNKRYCKWFWDESLGGEYEDWGTSTYLMEVGHNLYAVRQIEIYENGNILFYDSSHLADNYGMLCDKKFNEVDLQEFAITKAEFEEIWNSKIPMNRSAAEIGQE